MTIVKSQVNYGTPADIFSFGVCCYEVLMQKKPWSNVQRLSVLCDKVRGGERPTVAVRCRAPDGFRAIMTDCWHQDPDSRPSTTEVRERLEKIFDALRKNRSKKEARVDAAQTDNVARAVVHVSSDRIFGDVGSSAETIFAKADRDGDGFLSLEEFRSLMRQNTMSVPEGLPPMAPRGEDRRRTDKTASSKESSETSEIELREIFVAAHSISPNTL